MLIADGFLARGGKQANAAFHSPAIQMRNFRHLATWNTDKLTRSAPHGVR